MFKGTIRELEGDDIEAVETIVGLYWSGDLRNHFLKRVVDYVNHSPETTEQEYKYFVAVNQKEIVGFAGMRKVPEHMMQYVKTTKPVEFYIIGVKYKGRGVGTILRQKMIEEARKQGFTEAIFYSAEKHKDSWNFHDNLDFKKIGPAQAPNGDEGYIWRMELE